MFVWSLLSYPEQPGFAQTNTQVNRPGAVTYWSLHCWLPGNLIVITGFQEVTFSAKKKKPRT